MDTIELNNLNQPEGAEGGEGGEDETNIDNTFPSEDDFQAGIDRLNRQDDDVWTSSFRKKSKNDRFKKRRNELMELSTRESPDAVRIEFVKRLFENEYKIDPTHGPNSKEFISRLDIDENKLTFNKTDVAYIGTDGTYKLSENRKSTGSVGVFLKLYDKALTEHKGRAKSVVEEETVGETSRTNVE